jgi:hypothetical protein
VHGHRQRQRQRPGRRAHPLTHPPRNQRSW